MRLGVYGYSDSRGGSHANTVRCLQAGKADLTLILVCTGKADLTRLRLVYTGKADLTLTLVYTARQNGSHANIGVYRRNN